MVVDRTRKGSLVPQALGAGSAEVCRSAVFTALRERGEEVAGEGARLEKFLCVSWHILPQQQKAKSGVDLTVLFHFKEVCAPCPLPTYTSCKKDRSLSSIWIQGLRRGGAGMGTNSIFYNKTLFEKIYITLRIKMNALPLHMVTAQSCTHTNMVIFESELKHEHWIQKAVLKEIQELLQPYPQRQPFYSEPLSLNQYSECQVERNRKNQIFRPN